MRIVLLGLALLLLSLPVAAGEPCNAGSVDCCALEGTATGDIDMGAFQLTFDDKLDYIVGGTNLLDFRVNSQLLFRLAPTLINAYTSVNINGATHFLYNANAALKFGSTCTPTHNASGDTAVCGILDVVGASYFNSTTQFAGVVTIVNNYALKFGSGADAQIQWATGQTPDTLLIGTSTDSNAIVLVESADLGFDFAHPLQVNPTQFWHSANQTTTEWGSVAHDQTDFVVSSGAGDISLNPASGVVAITGDHTSYAQMVDEDNTDAFVIVDSAQPHSYHTNNLAAGGLRNWTFDAGGAGVSFPIASIADSAGASGTQILVTTTGAHGLAAGAIVSFNNLSAVPAREKLYVVVITEAATTFEVAETDSTNATGTMNEAATLIAGTGAAGTYRLSWAACAEPAGANPVVTFWVYVNATGEVGTKSTRKFGGIGDHGSQSAPADIVTIADGDRVSFTANNTAANGDITIDHMSLSLQKI